MPKLRASILYLGPSRLKCLLHGGIEHRLLGKVIHECFESFTAGLAQGGGGAEIGGIRLDEIGVEPMLTDEQAQPIAQARLMLMAVRSGSITLDILHERTELPTRAIHSDKPGSLLRVAHARTRRNCNCCLRFRPKQFNSAKGICCE